MRLLVTGASGQLGSYLLRECTNRAVEVIAWSGRRQGSLFDRTLRPVDLSDTSLAVAFCEARPDVILHTAAMTVLSDCLRDPQRAARINTIGSTILAELAHAMKMPLIHISTDMVFDGENAPYREEDPTSPLSFYGHTKAECERAVLAYPRNTVVRLPLLFGPSLIGRPTFFDQQVLALRQNKRFLLFQDEWRTPLSLLTAARGLLALLDADPLGLLHMSGPERLSRLEMGQRLAAFLGCEAKNIVAVSRLSEAAVEPRPRDVSLDSSKWRSLFPHQEWPAWEEALAQLMHS